MDWNVWYIKLITKSSQIRKQNLLCVLDCNTVIQTVSPLDFFKHMRYIRINWQLGWFYTSKMIQTAKWSVIEPCKHRQTSSMFRIFVNSVKFTFYDFWLTHSHLLLFTTGSALPLGFLVGFLKQNDLLTEGLISSFYQCP